MFRNRSETGSGSYTFFRGNVRARFLALSGRLGIAAARSAGCRKPSCATCFDSIVNTAKFSAVVGTALREGCDVSVHIDCEPNQLGLEDL